MLRRIMTMAVRGYVGGPAKSWVFTSAAMLLWRQVAKATQKNEIIDLSRTKPGDKIIIEHLDITHKQQMKDAKRAKKSDRSSAKSARREARAARKLARRS